MEKEYVKELLMPMIAYYIGPSILDGVHWFTYINEPVKDKQILELTQLIIKAGEKVDDIINIKQIPNGKVVTIKYNLYKQLATAILNEFFTKNPKFPKLKNLDLDNIKQQEKEDLANYISSLPLKTTIVDIYLYKMLGQRVDCIVFRENGNVYKKKTYGFYLTEKDIEDVNKLLVKSNRKIAKIKQMECLDFTKGLRYSLTLSDADILS